MVIVSYDCSKSHRETYCKNKVFKGNVILT